MNIMSGATTPTKGRKQENEKENKKKHHDKMFLIMC